MPVARPDDDDVVRPVEVPVLGDGERDARAPVTASEPRRCTGYGPAARPVGKYLRYKPDDVVAWFEALDSKSA